MILLTHLHDKALFMWSPRLRRQLVLQAAALLVQLHHWVLAMFRQDRTLTTLFIASGQTTAIKYTWRYTFYSRISHLSQMLRRLYCVQVFKNKLLKTQSPGGGTYVFWCSRGRGGSFHWLQGSFSVTTGLCFRFWSCWKAEILQDLWMTETYSHAQCGLSWLRKTVNKC